MGEQKITIKNDKGRLSQDEIDRMVDEAERYKAEDEANRVRMGAKNSLENYCYSMKNTMSDKKLASKLSDDDKSTVTAKIDETTSWLDANQMAEKEEYEAKQKELEAVVNPILAALGGGAGGMPGGISRQRLRSSRDAQFDFSPIFFHRPGGMPGGMPDMG